jgi:hypothetical protein
LVVDSIGSKLNKSWIGKPTTRPTGLQSNLVLYSLIEVSIAGIVGLTKGLINTILRCGYLLLKLPLLINLGHLLRYLSLHHLLKVVSVLYRHRRSIRGWSRYLRLWGYHLWLLGLYLDFLEKLVVLLPMLVRLSTSLGRHIPPRNSPLIIYIRIMLQGRLIRRSIFVFRHLTLNRRGVGF